MSGTTVSESFRKQAERASQDKLQGPVVQHYRKEFEMSKELKNVEKKIAHLEAITKSKNHGKTSDQLKILQQLSELYQKRNALTRV